MTTKVLTDEVTKTQYRCFSKRPGEYVTVRTQKLDDGTFIEQPVGVITQDPALLRFKVSFFEDEFKQLENEFFTENEAIDYLWHKTTQHLSTN